MQRSMAGSGVDYQTRMLTYSKSTVINDVLCANLNKDLQIPYRNRSAGLTSPEQGSNPRSAYTARI